MRNGRKPVAEYIVLGGRGCAGATHTHLADIVSTAAQSLRQAVSAVLVAAGCRVPVLPRSKIRLDACPPGAALLRRFMLAPPLGSY